MNKILNYGALIVAILAVAVIGLWFRNPIIQNLVDIPQQFSALSSPDIQSPYLCVNGVCSYYASGDCLDATTTVFAVLSPAATSTLSLLSVEGTNGTTTADFVVATSTAHSWPGTATTTLSAPLFVDISNMATSTYFCTTMGVAGEGLCRSAGASSKTKITLPPSTYVMGYLNRAQLIMTTGFGIVYPGNTASCSYKMRFDSLYK